MKTSDPRVGTRQGVTRYPPLTISGKPYGRPCTTRDIGDDCFVVLDMHPAVDVDAVIADLLTDEQAHSETEDES